MGFISKQYVKNFVCRYDKEVGVPYYSHLDFEGLKQDAFTFTNSDGIEIHYFYYYYDNYKQDKIILFCHGLGAGHAAYIAEIELLARRGYKVLTLDYTGCGESGGKVLGSLNAPTRDVNELLNLLKIEKPIILIGHSLGGYTALNIINLRNDIMKAIILSGFLSIDRTIPVFVKNKFIVSRILKYEQKAIKEYSNINNIDYLNKTTDDLFFIHSDNDGMIPYDISMKVVEQIDNPHIKTLLVHNRKHNPNYSDSAVEYMNEVFGNYYALINKKEIKTDQDKIDYFKDVSIAKMTEQDEELFNKIYDFIESK